MGNNVFSDIQVVIGVKSLSGFLVGLDLIDSVQVTTNKDDQNKSNIE
jgi:hypothetical protein